MSEISEAARAKAGELLNVATWREEEERVAAFIQQVSDAAKAAESEQVPGAPLTKAIMRHLSQLILPKPVDPLAEAVNNVLSGFEGREHAESYARTIRKHLAQRGFKIVPVQS